MDTDITVAVISFVGTALIGAIAYAYKSRKEVNAIRRAFKSEIRSLAEMIRLRRYIEDLLQCASELDDGVSAAGHEIYWRVPIDLATYRPIWSAYSSRIGSMSDEESAQFIQFYQLVDGVARDVSPGGVLHDATSDPRDFRDAAELLQQALTIADKITASK